MDYKAKNYIYLFGMKGFSNTLIKNHFILYQGYVNNTNKLLNALRHMLSGGLTNTPEYAELKRRLGWEFNGMRLHEYYFENLGGKGIFPKGSVLEQKMNQNFGSYDNWQKDFKATGLMRGIGWTILYQDLSNDRLINFWINEHDAGHPAGCAPLLIMDVWEHAYLTDYQLNRADYIEAFLNNINWTVVVGRLV